MREWVRDTYIEIIGKGSDPDKITVRMIFKYTAQKIDRVVFKANSGPILGDTWSYTPLKDWLKHNATVD